MLDEATAAIVAIGGSAFSDAEKKTIRRLQQCSFPSGSWDKRFVRDLGERLDDEERRDPPGKALSDAQLEQIRRIVHRYRRQGTGCRCDKCSTNDIIGRKQYQ